MLILRVLIAVLVVSFMLFAEEVRPSMFLCVDSVSKVIDPVTGKTQKIVYGYIDGKKTPCMSEYEFLALFSKETFHQQMQSVPDSQKLLEEKGLKIDLEKMDPREAVYRGKRNLAGADLSGLDLKGIKMDGADLEGARLDNADLRGADFRRANLRNASLQSAYCKGANFSEADLTGSILKGTYFHFAKLQNTKGLSVGTMRNAATFFKASMDTTLLIQIKEQYPKKLKDPGADWNLVKKPQSKKTAK